MNEKNDTWTKGKITLELVYGEYILFMPPNHAVHIDARQLSDITYVLMLAEGERQELIRQAKKENL